MKQFIRCLTFLFAVTLFVLPFTARAAEVPWTSELYTAYANSGYGYNDTQYGPPLPIQAYSSFTFSSEVTSTITSSLMDIDIHLWHSMESGWGSTSFSGSYTATEYNPFQFSYSLLADEYTSSWLTITDNTDGIDLYSGSLTAGTETILVSTTAGHAISVDFGISEDIYAIDEELYGGKATLNYSMTVVPEPVSTILFLTGGVFMAGRRFFRRA